MYAGFAARIAAQAGRWPILRKRRGISGIRGMKNEILPLVRRHAPDGTEAKMLAVLHAYPAAGQMAHRSGWPVAAQGLRGSGIDRREGSRKAGLANENAELRME